VEERLSALTLQDLESVRLVLRGNSVIDWHRLSFADQAEVDRFLRVSEFDPTSERDVGRLEQLRAEAVDYLQRNFGFRIPDDVAERQPVRELFLVASRKGRKQVYACIVLKVMHIIHHLAGRELLFRSPVSEFEIFHLVERKVVQMVDEIRGAGHPIVGFDWSRKPHDSLVTKLMAKKSTLAANVYDKLRFRMVTREERDLLPLIAELTQRLIPFNYVVPGESVNDIVNFRKTLEATPALARLGAQLQVDAAEDQEEARRAASGLNEFSGPGYRVINFVADLPVRLDDFLCRVGDPASAEFGAIVFVLTEFQVVDQKTAQGNETGENSHEKYKERQRARVKQRLLRGMAALERPGSSPGTGNGNGNGHGDDE
jgi:uncharacterized protein (TIGR04552 family)